MPVGKGRARFLRLRSTDPEISFEACKPTSQGRRRWTQYENAVDGDPRTATHNKYMGVQYGVEDHWMGFELMGRLDGFGFVVTTAIGVHGRLVRV